MKALLAALLQRLGDLLFHWEYRRAKRREEFRARKDAPDAQDP